jgi:hypothetical protein
MVMKRALGSVLLVYLLAGMSFAFPDENPFVGTWKLNGSKTDFSDRMTVKKEGANKYIFDFGGGPEAILVDGTEQAAGFGTSLIVTPVDPHKWTVVRKSKGRTLITAIWTLSADENTLTDDFTEFGADGSPFTIEYVYRKKAEGTGFAGTWTSTSATLKSAYLIQIRAWEGDGLSIADAIVGQTKNVRFDGKDYPKEGPNGGPNATTAVRRVDERTLELTDKRNGKITATERVTLSADLKTLTITLRLAGSSEPQIQVFDRQ